MPDTKSCFQNILFATDFSDAAAVALNSAVTVARRGPPDDDGAAARRRELLRGGPDRLAETISGMTDWLTRKRFGSVQHIKGLLSQRRAPNASAFERVNYLCALMSLTSE